MAQAKAVIWCWLSDCAEFARQRPAERGQIVVSNALFLNPAAGTWPVGSVHQSQLSES